ncbi:hypothetical protein K504DRAFT_535782 [Pleomassaria siparia CBS 279.74]|uniref:BTB domain-containing protein n=1 Tax=Pleomassaria siparia CBS 279.74 TaxID=1314801 RepID=A0A6G1K380_9PLEO|nr:hypothetical protein K504DRAFT_535782 [Pleomassaria siparia CBS 279.74]
MRHHRSSRPRRSITVCDWDDKELGVVVKAGLEYTLRKSKYRWTVQNPTRVILVIDDDHQFSAHVVLLQHFSTRLEAQLKKASEGEHVRVDKIEGVGLRAWEIWLEWLYTFDKIPLPDYTPLRRESWSTGDIMEAYLLSAWMGSIDCEKYLFRIIYKEIYDGRFSHDGLHRLSQRIPKNTGLWHFYMAYMRWKKEGKRKELDPYMWRWAKWRRAHSSSIATTSANLPNTPAVKLPRARTVSNIGDDNAGKGCGKHVIHTRTIGLIARSPELWLLEECIYAAKCKHWTGYRFPLGSPLCCMRLFNEFISAGLDQFLHLRRADNTRCTYKQASHFKSP